MLIFFIPDEIKEHFIRFGPLSVDWPHKAQSKAYFPPKGIIFKKPGRYRHVCMLVGKLISLLKVIFKKPG